MKGEKMLIGLSYIDRKFIDESENDTVSGKKLHESSKQEANISMKRTIKRPLLIAAIIALMLFLMGCAVVAYLRMENLKIGEYSLPSTVIGPTEANAGEETIPSKLEVLSMQGILNSPQYLAGQEWLAFTQSYEPSSQAGWESSPEYWSYTVLDQAMADKLDGICAKYGLHLIGKPWHETIDCTHFLKLAGIDSLVKHDSAAQIWLPQGRFFPGGSFTVYGYLTPEGENKKIELTYHLVQKDVFYDVFAYVNADTTTQRNMTTVDGVEILLLEAEASSMILVDREDCFLSITLGSVGDTSLETIANCFDFSIVATPIDASAADAREQANIDSDPYKDIGRRSTYAEYIEDLLYGASIHANTSSPNPETGYVFYDLDGNGVQELLIVNMESGRISCAVAMVNGKTDEGKSYSMELYEDNILIDHVPYMGETAYHIFRFANNGDPMFSNPKEVSIVRLRKDTDGIWWRTSSTDHYADFDTQITEDEAMSILNAYKRIELDVRPITEFVEP